MKKKKKKKTVLKETERYTVGAGSSSVLISPIRSGFRKFRICLGFLLNRRSKNITSQIVVICLGLPHWLGHIYAFFIMSKSKSKQTIYTGFVGKHGWWLEQDNKDNVPVHHMPGARYFIECGARSWPRKTREKTRTEFDEASKASLNNEVTDGLVNVCLFGEVTELKGDLFFPWPPPPCLPILPLVTTRPSAFDLDLPFKPFSFNSTSK